MGDSALPVGGQAEALRSLGEMERTGGEPDVVGIEEKTSELLFADYRHGHVFLYHNGPESYYAARGFRCVLRV